jgi:hypothetical protein
MTNKGKKGKNYKTKYKIDFKYKKQNKIDYG